MIGALAAIPVAGTIQVILREWLRQRRVTTPQEAAVPAGPAPPLLGA